jgi:TANFOR domain-containing protein
MRRLIGIAMIMITTTVAQAQNYPVQSTMQILPPYSLYLQDYVSDDNRMGLIVLLKDIGRPEYRVRFKFSIEGNGISISTDQRYLPPPTILQGGVPLVISGPELAEYLNPFNLAFSGITRQEFQKTGKLPEGPYRICFQVLDYNIGIPVSNLSCNTAWLMLNDPPLVNLPANNSKVRATDPQNLVFQWTPRHTGSPNAAFNTEYYFKMVEVWPPGRNPFDALNVGTPFFETTTDNTAIIYSIAEPSLVPGRSYAFRVQARQKDGLTERDLFKNSGYSEVFTFTYGDECFAPTNIQAASPDGSRIKLNWQGAPSNTEYTLQYKETGASMDWREEKTFLSSFTLSSLKPGVSYDIQLEGVCSSIHSKYSPVLTHATVSSGASAFECGRAPEGFSLDNTTPISSINAGDVILSGDFEINVTEATGGSGVFTGKGTMSLPFMNYVKVQVSFSNISINTDKRVFNGKIIVNGIGL